MQSFLSAELSGIKDIHTVVQQSHDRFRFYIFRPSIRTFKYIQKSAYRSKWLEYCSPTEYSHATRTYVK